VYLIIFFSGYEAVISLFIQGFGGIAHDGSSSGFFVLIFFMLSCAFLF